MFIYCTCILHTLNFQADLFSGALFITQTFKDLNLYVAVIILLAISALFTICGKYNYLLCTFKSIMKHNIRFRSIFMFGNIHCSNDNESIPFYV